MNQIQLQPAFWWMCPDCKTQNFEPLTAGKPPTVVECIVCEYEAEPLPVEKPRSKP